ncbi:hypothetical protein GCM10020001_070250 [Nonomuraea salmonea]
MAAPYAAVPGDGLALAGAADHHDGPAHGGEQRVRALRHQQRGRQVELDDLGVQARRGAYERRGRRPSGVVDHHVEPLEPGDQPLHVLRHPHVGPYEPRSRQLSPPDPRTEPATLPPDPHEAPADLPLCVREKTMTLPRTRTRTRTRRPRVFPRVHAKTPRSSPRIRTGRPRVSPRICAKGPRIFLWIRARELRIRVRGLRIRARGSRIRMRGSRVVY